MGARRRRRADLIVQARPETVASRKPLIVDTIDEYRFLKEPGTALLTPRDRRKIASGKARLVRGTGDLQAFVPARFWSRTDVAGLGPVMKTAGDRTTAAAYVSRRNRRA